MVSAMPLCRDDIRWVFIGLPFVIHFQNVRYPGDKICENVGAIQFVKHFVPTTRIEIMSD
jgi:hypothetical protein